MESEHCLLMEPNEVLLFEYIPNASTTSVIHLKNPSSSNLAFKLKTNSRTSYFVRPTQGILSPFEEKTVTVILQGKETAPDTQKDKFLILYAQTNMSAACSAAELNKYWLTAVGSNFKSAKLSVGVFVSSLKGIHEFIDKKEEIEGSGEGNREEKTREHKKGEAAAGDQKKKGFFNEIANFELKFGALARPNYKLLTIVGLVAGFLYCIA